MDLLFPAELVGTNHMQKFRLHLPIRLCSVPDLDCVFLIACPSGVLHDVTKEFTS